MSPASYACRVQFANFQSVLSGIAVSVIEIFGNSPSTRIRNQNQPVPETTQTKFIFFPEKQSAGGSKPFCGSSGKWIRRFQPHCRQIRFYSNCFQAKHTFNFQFTFRFIPTLQRHYYVDVFVGIYPFSFSFYVVIAFQMYNNKYVCYLIEFYFNFARLFLLL